MNARTEQLFNDKEFVVNLLTLNADEAKAAIEAEGGEITYEELHEIGQDINEVVRAIEENGGELTPEILDAVSGGSWKGACRGAILGCVGGFFMAGPKGAAAGALGGFVVGAIFW